MNVPRCNVRADHTDSGPLGLIVLPPDMYSATAVCDNLSKANRGHKYADAMRKNLPGRSERARTGCMLLQYLAPWRAAVAAGGSTISFSSISGAATPAAPLLLTATAHRWSCDGIHSRKLQRFGALECYVLFSPRHACMWPRLITTSHARSDFQVCILSSVEGCQEET